MNNKKYMLMLLLSVFFLVITILVGVFHRYNASHFSCSGVYSASYHDIMLHANARMTFFGSEGTVVLNGVLEDDSNKISNIVVSTVFNFKKVRESFVLIATKNTVEASEEEEKEILKNILPEFYYYTGASVIYDIFPQGKNYLFVRGGVPVFFCKR